MIPSEKEFESIEKGLEKIRKKIQNNEFTWSESLEDVHMNIEAELTREIGEAGKASVYKWIRVTNSSQISKQFFQLLND